MKQLWIILTIIIGIIGVAFGTYSASKNLLASNTDSTSSTQQTVLGQESEPPTSPASSPVRLSIPKLNVSAAIESVGVDAEGRMDVPKDYQNVAWYERGPSPGELGSAVIAGHLDSPTGAAVFYELDKLAEGDEIIVGNKDGTNQMFVVTDVQTFSDAEFPLDLVFKQTDAKRLNLITCKGTFDSSASNYSHRLVVFAELKE